ncbi:glutamyl-trna amidotransferase [Ophiostoma piceae UAMH 11346]|uniref:Glutamyl-trna amidotransferase n=1 Tax=Ophiostoma piceae (strain UAMH 11346) TaxID=1262450 RepID=S3C549_OPHP1|nr:glutamyl-trna amidotransferase [Ophiostoma piceae UAMH 11346]
MPAASTAKTALGLLLSSFVAFSSGSSTGSRQLASTGLTASINGVDYYASPYPSGSLLSAVCPSLATLPSVLGFVPVTVLQDDGVSIESLGRLFSNWTVADDVFQSGFLGAVLLPPSSRHVPTSCRSQTPSAWNSSLLSASGRKPLVYSSLAPKTVPSGPYFLNVHTGDFHPVYRLYSDYAQAFVETVLQTPQGSFLPLSAHTAGSAAISIAVPSRLYYKRTAKKPLAGVRVGVKDIYRLAGIRGSNGNRAYYSLYPPANETGTAVQRLIDAGAIVVGLQKTSQFANGETATADWVDYHSPFNPRGNGYQDPSSSSAGAGASIASYDWLDIAIGSDTGGSIRGPSAKNGVFGNRPTHGLVGLDHVMPLSPDLDTAGLITRDPYLWDIAQQALYGPENYKSFANKKPNYPTQIYVVDFQISKLNSTGLDAGSRKTYETIVSAFLNGLAKVTNGSFEEFAYEDAWKESGPRPLRDTTSLNVLLNSTYATLVAKDQARLLRDQFYADYAAAHDGRRPHVNPIPLSRWAYGDSLPSSARDEAAANKTEFANWFNSQVLVKDTKDPLRCSSALMVYVGDSGSGGPSRDLYLRASPPPFGFSRGRFSPFSGCPDVVFPLPDETTVMNDVITGHEEQYPVSVDVLAARGCDGMLARLAQDLSALGLVAQPKVGSTL